MAVWAVSRPPKSACGVRKLRPECHETTSDMAERDVAVALGRSTACGRSGGAGTCESARQDQSAPVRELPCGPGAWGGGRYSGHPADVTLRLVLHGSPASCPRSSQGGRIPAVWALFQHAGEQRHRKRLGRTGPSREGTLSLRAQQRPACAHGGQTAPTAMRVGSCQYIPRWTGSRRIACVTGWRVRGPRHAGPWAARVRHCVAASTLAGLALL